jgi:SpoVK/Ycf46/Vps4 family AAA+-type ATPase
LLVSGLAFSEDAFLAAAGAAERPLLDIVARRMGARRRRAPEGEGRRRRKSGKREKNGSFFPLPPIFRRGALCSEAPPTMELPLSPGPFEGDSPFADAAVARIGHQSRWWARAATASTIARADDSADDAAAAAQPLPPVGSLVALEWPDCRGSPFACGALRVALSSVRRPPRHSPHPPPQTPSARPIADDAPFVQLSPEAQLSGALARGPAVSSSSSVVLRPLSPADVLALPVPPGLLVLPLPTYSAAATTAATATGDTERGMVDVGDLAAVWDLGVLGIGRGDADDSASGSATPSSALPPLLPTLLHGSVLSPGQVVRLPLFGPRAEGAVSLRVWPDWDGAPVGEVGPPPSLFRVLSTTTTRPTRLASLSYYYSPYPPPPTPPLASWLDRVLDACPGQDAAARALLAAITTAARHPISPAPSSPGGGGILLTGPPGSGKSALALALAQAASLPVFRVTASGLYSGVLGESEEIVRRLVAAATSSSPCVVLLEEVDILLPAVPGAPVARRCAAALLRAMEETRRGGASPSSSPSPSVVWVALTSNPAALSGRALGPARLSTVVRLGLPGPEQRLAMLLRLARGLRRGVVAGKGGDCEVSAEGSEEGEWRALLLSVADRTHGFSPADLAHLVTATAGAVMRAMDVVPSSSSPSPPLRLWTDAFASTLPTVRPSLLLLALGSPPRPVVLGTDLLGSMGGAVAAAVSAVLTPLAHPQYYAGAAGGAGAGAGAGVGVGASPPRGLLLHGPPGCGKTLLAHAIAHAARERGLANALVVQGTDIVSALVGASEAALSAAFERARELAPCVLVLDGIEVLAPVRVQERTRKKGKRRGEKGEEEHEEDEDDDGTPGGGSGGGSLSGSGDRLLSVLLTEMDGLGGSGSSSGSATAADGPLAGLLFRDAAAAVAASAPAQLVSPAPLASLSLFEAACFAGAGGASGPRLSPATAPVSAPRPVIVIAVAPSPHLLDPAILRPGRLDTHVRVPLPDAGERTELLHALFARSPLEDPRGNTGSAAVAGGDNDGEEESASWPETVARLAGAPTEGWSRAALEGLWHDAAMAALRRSVSGGGGEGSARLTRADVEGAVAGSGKRWGQ